MPVPEPDPADCVWVVSWSAELRLEARASLSTLFVCQTFPSLPELPTLIGSFVFDAPFCSAAEKPSASCSFFADWSAIWIPVEPWQPHVQQHAPERAPPDRLQTLLARPDGLALEALVLQHGAQRLAYPALVVNDENRVGHRP